jgi:hypothetical protein
MTANHEATDAKPADVPPEMLAAALRALQPFVEEDGVLSTSVMRQALHAALVAALRSEHPVYARTPKVFR